MVKSSNPFVATLGADPPLLVGRQEIVEDFELALDEGPGSHERISLLVGPRGIGKTVVLNELEAQARRRGWIVVSETARRGFVDKLTRRLSRERARHASASAGKKKLSVGSQWFRVEREIGSNDGAPQESLSEAFDATYALIEELDHSNGVTPGIMVTLDELHYHHEDELIEFAVTIQHLVREGRDIAVALAAIPQSIKPLLASNDGRSPITFLRRANRVDLGRVSDQEVAQGLVVPVEELGWEWEPEALDRAVAASGGYPFMMQLIGHWCVRRMGSSGKIITGPVARDAIARARKKLCQLVHAPALDDLSDEDKRFLAAMAVDDGPSKVTEIAQRLGVSDQQAYNYRRRLAEANIVESTRGTVAFALPYLREYLQQHVIL